MSNKIKESSEPIGQLTNESENIFVLSAVNVSTVVCCSGTTQVVSETIYWLPLLTRQEEKTSEGGA